MRWTQVQEDWPAFIPKVEEEWPAAERDVLETLDGDRSALRRHLAEVTGQDAAEIEEEIRVWLEMGMPLDVMMDETRDDAQITESARFIPAGEDVYSDDQSFGDDDTPEPPVGRD